MTKLNKGITLIVLIITIIVLLVLAGITINMVLGDSGLLNKAKTSVAKYENAQGNEMMQLTQYENMIDSNYIMDNSRNITITLTEEQLNQKIQEAVDSKTAELSNRITELETNNSKRFQKYYVSNGNAFSTISLETGDYLLFINANGWGGCHTKPAVYLISFGDVLDNNTNKYTAYSYLLLSGEQNYTVTISPRTTSNNKATLSISCPYVSYYYCTLEKIK